VEVQRHAFLTSTLEGGEWTASSSGHFTPEVTAPGTHWIAGQVGQEPVWTRQNIERIFDLPSSALCSVHLILYDLVTQIIFGEG